MRWKNRRRSKNVVDHRGKSKYRMPGGGATVSLGSLVVFCLIAYLAGLSPEQILFQAARQVQTGSTGAVTAPSAPSRTAPAGKDDESSQFVATVLADLEETWGELFRNGGQRYQEPKLVLYENSIGSACGFSSSASGPFYCPGDQQVYLDLSFFRELKKLGASGDFAVAYVIAHEVGHHVQTLLGVTNEVRRAQSGTNRVGSNKIQVAMELQADCYAGVWAYHADTQRKLLEDGDIQEGLDAAAAVGDDRLQKMSGGRVHPESFTHGSSKQRMEWFKRGFRGGKFESCDTFEEMGLK